MNSVSTLAPVFIPLFLFGRSLIYVFIKPAFKLLFVEEFWDSVFSGVIDYFILSLKFKAFRGKVVKQMPLLLIKFLIMVAINRKF